MENESSLLNPLLEKAEAYGKTSLEIWKLKSVDATADLASTFVSRLIIYLALALFIIILSVAASLWIGELLGKTYYGFLLVAAFYGVLSLLLLLLRKSIKLRINNSLIRQLSTAVWKRSQA